jgi:putative NADH-flavin reductase
MAINQWKIWRKLGLKKREEEIDHVKPKEDLREVISFLRELDVKKLTRELEKMEEMIDEEGVVDGEIVEVNIKKQVETFDTILKDYGFLQNDTDINGLRLKKIGAYLLKKAKKAKLNELVKQKQQDFNWRE